MTRSAIAGALIATAVLTGAASDQRGRYSDAARLEKQLHGLTPGKPRDCIPRDRMGQTISFKDTILYVEGRNRKYRNDVVGGCAGLSRDDIIVTKSFSSQICRGDIVQTRDRSGGFLTGSCSLGQFVPYTK